MKKNIYTFKQKPYYIFQESKMKINGEWIDCVIYKTLYHNPDGELWVRSSEEFFSLFTKLDEFYELPDVDKLKKWNAVVKYKIDSTKDKLEDIGYQPISTDYLEFL